MIFCDWEVTLLMPGSAGYFCAAVVYRRRPSRVLYVTGAAPHGRVRQRAQTVRLQARPHQRRHPLRVRGRRAHLQQRGSRQKGELTFLFHWHRAIDNNKRENSFPQPLTPASVCVVGMDCFQSVCQFLRAVHQRWIVCLITSLAVRVF